MLFRVILAAVVLVAYLGITTSSSADLVLATGEVAVIAALAITILVRVGPGHYTAAVFSPASSPHGQFSDLTSAMIYGPPRLPVSRLRLRSARRQGIHAVRFR